MMNFTDDFTRWLFSLGIVPEYTSPQSIRLSPSLVVCLIHLGDNHYPSSSEHYGPTIFLWEDVWFTHKSLVKARILARMGTSGRVPARLCEVKKITQPTLDDFLAKHHLQGSTRAKTKIGLFLKPQYENRFPAGLLAVASFGSIRPMPSISNNHRSAELIRFASVAGLTVVGGLNKLIQYYVREFQPDDLMTYADADWSDGHSYRLLGFEQFGTTPSQNYYLDSELRRHYPHRFADQQKFMEVFNRGSIKFVKFFK